MSGYFSEIRTHWRPRIGRMTVLFDEIEGRAWLNSNGVSRRARREWRPRTMKFHGTVAPSSR